MIFATVGTSQIPFTRLVGALETLPRAEVVVQHGPARPPEGVARAMPFMSFTEIVAEIATAEVVVSHAGVGSVLCAIRAGHVPVVVPRLDQFGEMIDDHQSELAEALGDQGKVIPVWDVGTLADAVAAVPPRQSPAESDIRPMHAAVRSALRGESVVRRRFGRSRG